jgi:phthalate 4,5-dioxygenase
VPIDDGHCFGLGMHKVASVDTPDGTRGFRDPTKLLPNTTNWLGRFRTEANARNDFQIDREKQRTLQSYTGLPSVTLEDQAVTESMSEIYDRTQERLGTSDTMIIRTRRGGCSTARWSARRWPQGPAPPSARTRPACS